MELSQILRRPTEKRASDLESTDLASSISDERFMHQLDQVRKLKKFLFEEKVNFKFDQLGAIDLGVLNSLRHRHNGRTPTNEEWRLLDEKMSILTSYLTDDLRQKVRLRDLSVFFGYLPVIFLLAAACSTAFYFLESTFLSKELHQFAYFGLFTACLIIWTLSQGGLGACAFLGVRATIRQVGTATTETERIDLTDKPVLRIRITLGALFAFLIGLPFSYKALDTLYDSLFSNNPGTEIQVKGAQLALIVIPFMLGFSTNLALQVLDRFIISIRTFLGISTEK